MKTHMHAYTFIHIHILLNFFQQNKVMLYDFLQHGNYSLDIFMAMHSKSVFLDLLFLQWLSRIHSWTCHNVLNLAILMNIQVACEFLLLNKFAESILNIYFWTHALTLQGSSQNAEYFIIGYIELTTRWRVQITLQVGQTHLSFNNNRMHLPHLFFALHS